MKALHVTAHDAPPALVDLRVPEPSAGQVRIRVAACGLNFADLLMLRGTYQATPSLPFVPGMEVSGVVEAAANGAVLAVGTPVAAVVGHGGLAERVVADAARCVPVPDGLPMIEAAGALIAHGTSHMALTRVARLRPGERLAVLGASGGVGLTAVEIGAALGAEVIAVARGADKLALAGAAGAARLLDAGAQDLAQRLKALDGIDVVYDAVGGAVGEAGFAALRPGGRFLVIGFASGEVPRLRPNHMMVKNLQVLGFYWGGMAELDLAAFRASLDEVMAGLADGRLRSHVSATFPLDRAAEALDHLASRRATGKIVVTVGAADHAGG